MFEAAYITVGALSGAAAVLSAILLAMVLKLRRRAAKLKATVIDHDRRLRKLEGGKEQ